MIMGGGVRPCRFLKAAGGSPSVAILSDYMSKGQACSPTEGKRLGRVANMLVHRGDGDRIGSRPRDRREVR